MVAKLVDRDENGNEAVLREGQNGFTCFPGHPWVVDDIKLTVRMLMLGNGKRTGTRTTPDPRTRSRALSICWLGALTGAPQTLTLLRTRLSLLLLMVMRSFRFEH